MNKEGSNDFSKEAKEGKFSMKQDPADLEQAMATLDNIAQGLASALNKIGEQTSKETLEARIKAALDAQEQENQDNLGKSKLGYIAYNLNNPGNSWAWTLAKVGVMGTGMYTVNKGWDKIGDIRAKKKEAKAQALNAFNVNRPQEATNVSPLAGTNLR